MSTMTRAVPVSAILPVYRQPLSMVHALTWCGTVVVVVVLRISN